MRRWAGFAFGLSCAAIVIVGAALESRRPEPEEPEVRIPIDLEDGLSEFTKLDRSFLIEFRALGSEEETGRYHFSFGMWLRHAWKLWDWGNGETSAIRTWFEDRGIDHGDHMSGIILVCFWRRLRGRPVDAEALIRGVREGQTRAVAIDASGTILVRGSPCGPEELVEELFKRAEKCRDLDDPEQPSLAEVVVHVDRDSPWRAGRAILDAFRHPAVRIYRVSFEMDGEDDPIAAFLPIAFAPPGHPEERTCQFPGRVEVALHSEPFDTGALANRLSKLAPSWKSVPAILRPADEMKAETVLRALLAIRGAGASLVVIEEPPPPGARIVSVCGEFAEVLCSKGDSPPTRTVRR